MALHAPSALPNPQPTISSSSYSYSYSSYSMPTTYPPTSVPISTPTFVPIPAPTVSPMPVTILLTLSMTGMACSEYGEDEEGVMNQAIASHLDGVSEDDFSAHTCTDQTRRGRALKGTSDSISISTEVTVDTTDYSDDNVLDAVASTIAAVVSSGELASSVSSFATAAGVTMTIEVTGSSAVAATPSPVASSTPSPTLSPVASPADDGTDADDTPILSADDTDGAVRKSTAFGLSFAVCTVAAFGLV